MRTVELHEGDNRCNAPVPLSVKLRIVLYVVDLAAKNIKALVYIVFLYGTGEDTRLGATKTASTLAAAIEPHAVTCFWFRVFTC